MSTENRFDGQGVLSQQNIMNYKDGVLVSQSIKDKNNKELSNSVFHYDDVGNIKENILTVHAQAGSKAFTLTHNYIYALWNGYLQDEDNAIHLEAGTKYLGKSKRSYDANGLLTESVDTQADANGKKNTNKYYNSSMDGLKARADQDGKTYYLNAANKTLGDLRLNKTKKQEMTLYGGFTPQGSQQKVEGAQTNNQFLDRKAGDLPDGTLPESTQDNIGAYTLQGGDSLESVALQVYGDSSLWYLIADANGILCGKEETAANNRALHVGQRLTIPPVTTGQHHTSTTRKILSGEYMLGNTSATTKTPPPPPPPPIPKSHKRIFSMILVGIVATVATVITAGIAGALLGATSTTALNIFALGTSVLSGTAELGLLGTMTAAFTGGFVGSIASQGVASALRLQDGISSKGALINGLITAATAGVLHGLSSYNKPFITKLGNKESESYFNLVSAAETMESNATSQGISLLTHQQKSFEWDQFGISIVTSGLLAGKIGSKIQSTLKDLDFGTGILNSEIKSTVKAGANAAIGGKFDATATLTNNLGSAIGDMAVDKLSENPKMNTIAPLRLEEEPSEQISDEEFQKRWYKAEEKLYPAPLLDIVHPEKAYETIALNTVRFNKIIENVLGNEGSLSNHKNDRGGLTNMGVTIDTYNQVAKKENLPEGKEGLKKLTYEQAKKIYKKYYWDAIKADKIESDNLAYSFFDFYVNAPKSSVKAMQKAINEVKGETLKVDGKYGPQTLNAINSTDSKKLFNAFREKRIEHYISEGERDHTQKVFVKGWLRRANRIKYEE